jgi:hypothetical protein
MHKSTRTHIIPLQTTTTTSAAAAATTTIPRTPRNKLVHKTTPYIGLKGMNMVECDSVLK